MYEYNVRIADHVIRISAIYIQTGVSLKDYLTDEEAEIHIEMSDRDIRREWRRMLQSPRYSSDFVNRLPGYYFENFALNRKVSDALLRFDTIAFHGSAVAVDGACSIFAADSGVGKSTYARLWAKHFGNRAYVLNDDKPFLHVTPKEITVYGSPWDGKHHVGKNEKAPLKNICFLHRAERSGVCRMTDTEALDRICYQIFRPDRQEDFDRAMELLRIMAKSVPFYEVGFTLNSAEITDVYQNLTGGNA